MEKPRKIFTGYIPREWQAKTHVLLKRHNVLVFHRRGGKTVFCVNEILDQSVRFNKFDPKTNKPFKNPTYAYLATTAGQAERVAWPYFKMYMENIPGVKFNNAKLTITYPHPRGLCTIYCMGTENYNALLGMYLDGYVLDEYADMHPDVRDRVVLPMLSDRKGWEIIIGTPRGENAFKELYDTAVMNPDMWFSCLCKASETGIIDPEELRMLQITMSEEAYNQEYECDFNAAPAGKYYQKYMDDALREGRITDVPHNPNCLVSTYWDLGRDGMAVWFVQEVGREVHVIEYCEETGKGLEWMKDLLDRKEREDGYKYNEHILPHDADHTVIDTNCSRVETLVNMGVPESSIRVLSRTKNIGEDINAVRVLLRQCYFDSKKCNPYINGRHRGIASLKEYARKWDTKLKIFMDKPLHNWSSHGADAFRQLAVDYQPGFGQSIKEMRSNLPSYADHDYDILSL